MEQKCPICNTTLIEHPTYRIIKKNKIREIGRHAYCPSMQHSYETNLPKRKYASAWRKPWQNYSKERG